MMICRTAQPATSDPSSIRAWFIAALRPLHVDPSYFDDLGRTLDLSAPTVEC